MDNSKGLEVKRRCFGSGYYDAYYLKALRTKALIGDCIFQGEKRCGQQRTSDRSAADRGLFQGEKHHPCGLQF